MLLGAVDVGLAGVARGDRPAHGDLEGVARLEVDDLQDVPDRPLVERGDLPLGDDVPAPEELEMGPVLEQDVERQS